MALVQWIAVLVCGFAVVLAQDDDQHIAVQGNNQFGNAWLKIQQRKTGAGNLNLSPFSAITVLAMLMMGAGGNTLTEIANGLRLPEDKEAVASGFQSMMKSLEEAGEGNNTLSVANRIYLDLTYIIKENYNRTVQVYFNSDILRTDFKGNPDQSRIAINEWVEEVTRDKIKDLLPDGSITRLTRTVLVNAIYFKGKWARQFDKSVTKSEKFYRSCNDAVDVDMMSQTDNFMYGDFGDYQVVELNYQEDRLRMMIILPRSCNGSTLLHETDFNVTQLHESMSQAKVHLSLPKFTIRQTIPMNEDLQELGLVEMYSDYANFSEMSDLAVQVTDVIQQTFIEVSEEGTEAAAATAVAIRLLASINPGGPLIHEFRADHPFIYNIMDGESKAILFVGEYRGN